MRNLILSALLIVASVGYAAAATPGDDAKNVSIVQNKVSVRPEDLPEAVKSALSGDGYADWKVSSAYLVTRENNSQYYEVNLKRGEESATLNLDKHGKKVD